MASVALENCGEVIKQTAIETDKLHTITMVTLHLLIVILMCGFMQYTTAKYLSNVITNENMELENCPINKKSPTILQ
jgi:hypothetical protein